MLMPFVGYCTVNAQNRTNGLVWRPHSMPRSPVEVNFDGLARLIQGQPVAWLLAVTVLVLSVAVLVLCLKIRGRR